MNITDIETHLNTLKNAALAALGADEQTIERIRLVDPPRPEMGDRGFNVGPMMKLLGRQGLKPPQIAEKAAEALRASIAADADALISEVIVAGPFVNMKINPKARARIVLGQIAREGERFGAGYLEAPQKWMFEYSAPNTNKPQHLGHVRNDLLGQSVTNILEFAGHDVVRVNLINDRGIHICKSMLAYKKFGAGETPESSGIKGDHLVGKYYVVFSAKFAEEYAAWQQAHGDAIFTAWLDGDEALVKAAKLNLKGARTQWVNARKKAHRKAQDAGEVDEKFDGKAAFAHIEAHPEELRGVFFKAYEDAYFNTHSALGGEAREMLVAWEAGDEDVRALWSMMNQWVFDGFDVTYERLGVRFDQVYYESETYKLGKDLVQSGLERGLFRTIDGGAIACPLDQIGLTGDKVLLRGDGTSVYMTQDLGTAMSRFDEHGMDHMVYVVGDEQRHHFKVLFGVLGLLRPELEGNLTHLSYGMVELPDGKMKSREGRVVDADDLMDGMVEEATRELLKRMREGQDELIDEADDLAALLDTLAITDDERAELAQRAPVIGMAGLKYYILDFNPTTTVHFDPKSSIKPTGRTGPYCLYTYARIQSIGRELGGFPTLTDAARAAACDALGTELELAVVSTLEQWPRALEVATRLMDPSKITEYLFELSKAFSSLYNDPDHRIKDIEGPRRDALLALSEACATTVAIGLSLLTVSTLDAM